MSFVRAALAILLGLLVGFLLPLSYGKLDIQLVQELQIWLASNDGLSVWLKDWLGEYAGLGHYWVIVLLTSLCFALPLVLIFGFILAFIGFSWLYLLSSWIYLIGAVVLNVTGSMESLKLAGYQLAAPLLAIGPDWLNVVLCLNLISLFLFSLFHRFFSLFTK